MNGHVDEFGRAVVELTIRSGATGEPFPISAWVDTAFNGELVIPQTLIDAAGLEQTGGILARLADGNDVVLESYACELDWFGERRQVEVVANDGQLPLLGVTLLLGHRLTVDYSELTLTIE